MFIVASIAYNPPDSESIGKIITKNGKKGQRTTIVKPTAITTISEKRAPISINMRTINPTNLEIKLSTLDWIKVLKVVGV
jgi:hypothetical protein